MRGVPCSACAYVMEWWWTQSGTTHYLGDNFAKAFNTQFLDEKGDQVGNLRLSSMAASRIGAPRAP